MSHRVNNLRRVFGRPYWPIAERVKLSIGASLRYIYGNTGDWVESCTALAESECGELSLLRWPETAHARLRPAAPVVADAA